MKKAAAAAAAAAHKYIYRGVEKSARARIGWSLCARYQRSKGKDVFFLTGTDEHGQKVEQSAEKRGVPPQELADENSATFRSAGLIRPHGRRRRRLHDHTHHQHVYDPRLHTRVRFTPVSYVFTAVVSQPLFLRAVSPPVKKTRKHAFCLGWAAREYLTSS